MTACVRVCIIHAAIDIKFNKEFTFQIGEHVFSKRVGPQSTISSVSVRHVRNVNLGVNCKNLQAFCLIGPSTIFPYRSLEELLILIFYERDFVDSGQLLEINELR